FHAWASQERHRPRVGAGKCRPAARVPAFEQAGGSPARGSSRGVSRIRPASPVCSELEASFDAMDGMARRKPRIDRPAEERRVSRRRISVVIPTWNRAGLVGEAVESALGQEGGDLEVIVVDDGSTDGTAEVIERRFGKSVKLLRMATRSGVGAARNEGVCQATGDLLAFLDPDDLWLPGKRRITLAFLSQKHGQFTYFSMQLGEPDWSKKYLLDF